MFDVVVEARLVMVDDRLRQRCGCVVIGTGIGEGALLHLVRRRWNDAFAVPILKREILTSLQIGWWRDQAEPRQPDGNRIP
jgi:hypothetical protein